MRIIISFVNDIKTLLTEKMRGFLIIGIVLSMQLCIFGHGMDMENDPEYKKIKEKVCSKDSKPTETQLEALVECHNSTGHHGHHGGHNKTGHHGGKHQEKVRNVCIYIYAIIN